MNFTFPSLGYERVQQQKETALCRFPHPGVKLLIQSSWFSSDGPWSSAFLKFIQRSCSNWKPFHRLRLSQQVRWGSGSGGRNILWSSLHSIYNKVWCVKAKQCSKKWITQMNKNTDSHRFPPVQRGRTFFFFFHQTHLRSAGSLTRRPPC